MFYIGLSNKFKAQIPNLFRNLCIIYSVDAELTSETDLDDTEQIEVVLKPIDEVIFDLKENKFLQALNVTALFHALIHINMIKF